MAEVRQGSQRPPAPRDGQRAADADGHSPAARTSTEPARRDRNEAAPAGDGAGPGETANASEKTADDPRRPAKPKRGWIKWAVIGGVVAVLVAVGVIWGIPYLRHVWTHESTDDAFIDVHAVQVSPKVSGYAVTVAVNDNEQVAAGDLLVSIDPRDYRVALDRANADLAAATAARKQAEAQRDAATAGVATAQADLASAEANRSNAEAELGRVRKLIERKAATAELLDQAAATAKSSEANVRSVQSRIASATADVELAEAQIAAADAQAGQAKASIEKAKLDLSYAEIRAPIAGRVAKRSVNVGDFLQVGQALLSVVPPDVFVTANFKETQLTHMRVGQPVEIEVDAFPDRPLKGHVDSFQPGTGARFSLLPPENATGNYVKVVQRVPVKIVFDEPAKNLDHLWPGLSVVPDVRVKEEE